jgi:hypothetical protein
MARKRKTETTSNALVPTNPTLDKSNLPGTPGNPVPVEVSVSQTLSATEKERLSALVTRVNNGVNEAYQALKEIHDSKPPLYRDFCGKGTTWKQFLEEACRTGLFTFRSPAGASHVFAQGRIQEEMDKAGIDTYISTNDAKLLAPLEEYPAAVVLVRKELDVESKKPGFKKTDAQPRLLEKMKRYLEQLERTDSLNWEEFKVIDEVSRLGTVLGKNDNDTIGKCGEPDEIKNLPKLIREAKMMPTWTKLAEWKPTLGDDFLPWLKAVVTMGEKLEQVTIVNRKQQEILNRAVNAGKGKLPDLRTDDEIEADKAEQEKARAARNIAEENAEEAAKVVVTFTAKCKFPHRGIAELIKADGCYLTCEWSCREGQFTTDAFVDCRNLTWEEGESANTGQDDDEGQDADE